MRFRAGVLLGGFASAVVLGAAAAAVQAQAAPTWLAPTKVSKLPHEAEAPQIAVDTRGDVLAAWRKYDQSADAYVVEAASRPAGGSWQAPVVVSGASEEEGAWESPPQVALDAGGDAVAAWVGEDAKTGEYSIQVATREGVSGAWSKPKVLQGLKSTLVTEPRPDVAMNARGEAVVVWQKYVGPNSNVEASVWSAGRWGAPETVSKEAVAMHVAEAGIDAAGDATAAWEQVAEIGTETYIRAAVASRPAGGKWEKTPTFLSQNPGSAIEPHLAENAAGEAVVIWERPPSGEELVEASTRSGPTAPWSSPAQLSAEATGKGEPAPQQVGIDAHGDAVAVWSRLEGKQDIVEAVVGRVPTDKWGASETISAKGNATEETPQVAVDESGAAVIVWPQWNGTNEVVVGVSGSAVSGTWGPPAQVSANGENGEQAGVAIDSQGDAAAVWLRGPGMEIFTEVAGFDAAGPQLNGLSIPASGTVGVPVGFSVSPFDVWSALGATSWSFGDGSSGAGAIATHTYSKAGTYTVTVASADALGNTTSTQATITVGPAAPCPCLGLPRRTVLRLPPVISRASLSHSRFRVSRRTTAVSASKKSPQGTVIRFTLDDAAALRVAFDRSLSGLRSGRRCLAPSASLRRRHAVRCTRTLAAGALTRAHAHTGANALAFSGRIGAKALAAGNYRAVLTASDGSLTSAPVSLAFTIVH